MEKTLYNTDSTQQNGVQRGVEAAGAALHNGIDMVADPARTAVDKFAGTAHQTIDKLAGSASSTADRISEQTRRIVDAPSRALDTSKSWVQERPLEAVAAALTFGFVLGRLTAR